VQLVFIFGPVASGKLTVARELCRLRSYRLFHRHLVEDMASALFPPESEPFMRLREYTLLEAFREATEANVSLVFTFLPERTARESFVSHATVVVDRLGGQMAFVELTCPQHVIESRLANSDRRAWGKITDVAQYRTAVASGAFAYRALPIARLRIDTSNVTPAEAARQIDQALG
jgi:hypothetical protein